MGRFIPRYFILGILGDGETNRESSPETYTLWYVKKIAGKNLLSDENQELTLGLCDNLEGWDGVGGRFKREGTYVYLWRIHVDVWQNQHNIVKLKKNKIWEKKEKRKEILKNDVIF